MTWLFSPGSLFLRFHPLFLGWHYRWAATLTWPLHALLGSELGSSCLGSKCSNHWAISLPLVLVEVFFLLQHFLLTSFWGSKQRSLSRARFFPVNFWVEFKPHSMWKLVKLFNWSLWHKVTIRLHHQSPSTLNGFNLVKVSEGACPGLSHYI